MKKWLSILLAMVLVVSLFAGCQKRTETSPSGNNESTATEAKGTVETTQKVEAPSLEGKTIVVGRWGGNEAETAAFTKAVNDFTASTGILVKEKVYSDYNIELQAELIGGTAPDVFYVDAYMAPFYIQQGILMPLDPAEFELEQFYQPLKDAFLKDGKYYAVSKDYSTLALYYNKKYVKESDIPKTMEELFNGDYLTRLKAKLPKGMAAMTYNQDLARSMFIAQAGGASIVKEDILSNLDDAKVVENMKLEYNAAIAGKIVTPADLGQGWNGDAFGNGKTAIMIEGNWVLGHLATNFPDLEFGVLEVPTVKGEKGTMVFTVGYSINVAAKEVDAAKSFIKYITGPEGMATWTTGAGVLPSRMDVTKATNVESDLLKVPHIAGAAYATAWQKGTTMDTINTEFKNYIPSVVSKERSLVEALKIAAQKANETIKATN